MNELADAVLALGVFDFAVEVFADDDVGGQLASSATGTSQSVCSNRTSPFSSLMAAVRSSHSTVSNGSATSVGQNWASIERPRGLISEELNDEGRLATGVPMVAIEK